MSLFGKIGSAVLGGAAGLKLYDTKHQSRQNGKLIRAAYEKAQANLGVRQGDVRQQTTESLNARGILSGGSGSVAPDGADRFVGEGMIGETGAQGTLGGQVERDLSKEFTKERRDLWDQRQTSIAQNKVDTMTGYVNDLASTAATGAQFGTPGLPSIAAAYGGAPRSYGAAGSGAIDPGMTQRPIASSGIRGAFGLSPVDGSGHPEIGVASPGTDSFNFHI